MSNELSKSREFTIASLLAAGARHARLLIVVPFACGLFAGARGWAHKTYVATAEFLPNGAGDAGGAGRAAALAAQFGFALGGAATDGVDFYAELLSSADLLEAAARSPYSAAPKEGDAVRRYPDLAALWRVSGRDERETLDKTVDLLRSSVRVTPLIKAGMVRIEVRTASRSLSVEISRRLLGLTNEFNMKKRRTQAAAERSFAEQRLRQVGRDLRDAEAAVAGYLDSNHQYQGSPRRVVELASLQRKVELQQQVYLSMSQAAEMARLTEVRNTPVITVVSAPDSSARREGSTLLQALLGLFGGAVLSVVLILGSAFGSDLATSCRDKDPVRFEEFLRRLPGPLRRRLLALLPALLLFALPLHAQNPFRMASSSDHLLRVRAHLALLSGSSPAAETLMLLPVEEPAEEQAHGVGLGARYVRIRNAAATGRYASGAWRASSRWSEVSPDLFAAARLGYAPLGMRGVFVASAGHHNRLASFEAGASGSHLSLSLARTPLDLSRSLNGGAVLSTEAAVTHVRALLVWKSRHAALRFLNIGGRLRTDSSMVRYLIAQRIEARSGVVQVGLQRASLFGGTSEKITPLVMLRMLGGAYNGEGSSFENQVAAADARVQVPGSRVAFYGEWAFDDLAGAWLDTPARLGGAEFRAGTSTLLSLEYQAFSHSCCGNPPWYRHRAQETGWTAEGAPLARPLGGNGSEAVARVDHVGASEGLLRFVSLAVHVRERADENLFATALPRRSLFLRSAALLSLGRHELRAGLASEFGRGPDAVQGSIQYAFYPRW